MTLKTRIYVASATTGLAAIAGMAGLATLAAAAATETPTISTVVYNSTGTVVTNAVVGTSVHAVATVASSTASTSPTGTVDFNVYSNTSCTGSPTAQTGLNLVLGQATSSDTVLPIGGLSYRIHYSGQGNLYTSGDSACKPVSATQSGTISGTVFNDLNKNDKLDSGEAGLSGWTVWLHKQATTTNKWLSWFKKHGLYNDPIVATVTTDANGNYSFGNLGNGTYFVEEKVMTGWKQTSDDTKVVLNASKTSADVDFSNIAKNATSTKKGNGDKDHGNKDGHEKDNGKDKGADKNDDWHDNGNHNGWFKFNGNVPSVGDVFGWLHLGKNN